MQYSPVRNRIDAMQVAAKLQEDSTAFIQQQEQDYYKKLHTVCDRAVEEKKSIILVTGPSASGKTTTAKRIAAILEARGKKVNRISLDNFYCDTKDLPRWEDGYQNYESIKGLDLACFDRVMTTLLNEGEAVFPVFDFTVGKRSDKTFSLSFDSETFLILEGIHALNPLLFNVLQSFPALKIYISVHSEIVDAQDQLLLSARDLRLCRRILRDYHCRSTSCEGTLKMWKYVLMGEEHYIFPFREHADIHIDSIHAYEPFLYHDGLAEMIEAITPESPHYEYAKQLSAANRHFFPISDSLIPESSLIQEFIHADVLKQSKIRTV